MRTVVPYLRNRCGNKPLANPYEAYRARRLITATKTLPAPVAIAHDPTKISTDP